jgi:hypothetical protein
VTSELKSVTAAEFCGGIQQFYSCANRYVELGWMYVGKKKPIIIEAVRLRRLCWFGHVQRMKENRIPKRVWNQQDQEVDQQTDGKIK